MTIHLQWIYQEVPKVPRVLLPFHTNNKESHQIEKNRNLRLRGSFLSPHSIDHLVLFALMKFEYNLL